MDTFRWTRAYYSVPPEYFRREVWVRWDSRLVRIFNEQLEEIRVHVKQRTPGRFSTHPADIAPEKISGVERGTEWLLRRASAIGDHADRWAQEVIASRGIRRHSNRDGLAQPVHAASLAG